MILNESGIEELEWDNNGNVLYIGRAIPGTLRSQPRWVIKKYKYDSNNRKLRERFANGTNFHDKVWDDRTGYKYLEL